MRRRSRAVRFEQRWSDALDNSASCTDWLPLSNKKARGRRQEGSQKAIESGHWDWPKILASMIRRAGVYVVAIVICVVAVLGLLRASDAPRSSQARSQAAGASQTPSIASVPRFGAATPVLEQWRRNFD